MRRTALALALLLGSACDRSLSPRAPSFEPASILPIPSPDIGLEPPRTPRYPNVTELSLAPPSAVACDLHEAKWSGSLQLRDQGPVFATVADTKSTVSIPQQRGPAWVSVEGIRVDVHGVLSKPKLYLAKPIALGGFIVPESFTELNAPGPNDAGRINVSFDIADVFIEPNVVHQELACDAFSLKSNGYDARKFVRANSIAPVTLAPGTDLRVTPDGPTVARIARSPRATITAGRWESGARRVVFEATGYFAVGWVPQAAVSRLTLGTGFGSGFGGRGRRLFRAHWTPCRHDLPLWAQVGGERAIVGTLRAGAAYERTSRPTTLDQAFVRIDVLSTWLSLAPSAMFLVRAADLEGC